MSMTTRQARRNPFLTLLFAAASAATLGGCAHPSAKPIATTASPLVFAVAGDAARWNANSLSARDSMLKLGVTRLVMPGDNIYKPHLTYAEAWANWISKGFTFDVVAIGNHNLGYAEEIAFFKMPGEYFSRAYPGIRFMVLNSDNETNVTAQLRWLQGELKRANEPLQFVVLHHPTFTTATQGHVWTEKRELQIGLRKLLKKYRPQITALLVGHDHLAELLRADDLPIVLSGAIQEVRQDMQLDNVQEGTHVRTLYYFGSEPTWVRLSAGTGGKNIATVDFIRAKDSAITCTAKIVTGSAPELQPNCPALPSAP